ncbi:MAG: methyltransferase family protein [Alphaproteobacteria bacterium]
MADAPDRAVVVIRPPLLYLGALALGGGLSLLWPLWDMPGWLRFGVGPGPLVLGIALMASAMGRFRVAGTSVPTNEPTKVLVTDGPYKHTRNPIYIALSLIYLGIAVVASSLWAILLLVPVLAVIDRGVIRPEEAYLAGKFGDVYRSYLSRTRRWI